MGARFFTPVQISPGAHPASCTMSTGSFPGVKSGWGMTLAPHPVLVPWSERVALYLYSPCGPYGLYIASVSVQGCTLPFSCHLGGPSSVVSIATGYGLDGPEIESRWGRDFPHLSRTALRPTQPSIQWVPGSFPGVKEQPGHDTDPSPPSSAVVLRE